MEEKTKNRTKKVLKITGNVLFWTAISFLLLVFLSNTIDRYTGYRFPLFGLRQSVIVSESMARADESNTYLTDDMKRIRKYDVILTRNYRSYNEIKMYDVLTYAEGSSLICHRVVDLYEDEGKQYIVTRGDSNNVDDTPIEYSLVRGKVINVTRGFGQVYLFVQSPFVFLAIFGSGFFIFLGAFIIDHQRNKKIKEQTPIADREALSKEKETSIEQNENK